MNRRTDRDGNRRMTIAEAISDEACLCGMRGMLLSFLRTRFETVPPELEARINATHSATRLRDWMYAALDVSALAEISFDSD
jgi:hypothetical protein